jgi:arginyl-tRNA synthetase
VIAGAAEGALRSHAEAAAEVQVEFVSANPTGPLHVGHGRQAALGDAIAALLESQGYAVTREFYYNDAGAQIENLALSVQARSRGNGPGEPSWPKDGYNGEYIQEIARDFVQQNGNLAIWKRFAVRRGLSPRRAGRGPEGIRCQVRCLLPRVEPVRGRKVDQVVRTWAAHGKTYEKDGALWLRTTDTATTRTAWCASPTAATPTFVPDVAYHVSEVAARASGRLITCRAPTTTAPSRACARAMQALGIASRRAIPITSAAAW